MTKKKIKFVITILKQRGICHYTDAMHLITSNKKCNKEDPSNPFYFSWTDICTNVCPVHTWKDGHCEKAEAYQKAMEIIQNNPQYFIEEFL